MHPEIVVSAIPMGLSMEGWESDALDLVVPHLRRGVEQVAAAGADFFINARTDLFLKTETYDDSLVDEVIERGKAYAESGASGFFVPRLADPRHAERVVREVPLPLNLIAFPGAPANREWANAGVARIS